MILLILVAVIAAVCLAAFNFKGVKDTDAGTDLMKEIAAAIQEGADAFLSHEYRIIFLISLGIMVILCTLVSWTAAVAYALGAFLSASAGWVGMTIAVIANVRVSNTARVTSDIGKTLKVAFKGGSVMGLCVGGFALLGLLIIYFVFGKLLGQLEPSHLVFHSNWMGISDIPFTMTVSAYALGCSIIAMFNRVGGGIYTKAADMGADLVGKTEAGIPEDDPRNPATIADNVGDNVGDVAGLGSDLLESFVGALISAVVLAIYTAFASRGTANEISGDLVQELISFPLIFAAVGLLASIAAILWMMMRKATDHPHKDLNLTTFMAAGLTLVLAGAASWYTFKGESPEALKAIGFNAGALSPWISAVFGIIAGILIGNVAEYFTSYDYSPTQNIAAASIEGPALTITQGMSAGMLSVFFPVILLGGCIIAAFSVAGLYGVAMAAIGMLSFVTVTVSVDTYGPIADNAGGISEMAKLDSGVRDITNKLDAVGNTTAAIGKGFAIGSAALATLSLFVSFLYAQAGEGSQGGISLILNMVDPMTLVGGFVGGALPYLFSGILIQSVANAARKMVQEVRRQFKDDPGIMAGTSKPDYKKCVTIASVGALAEMKVPALIAVLSPLVAGFLFGANFVGGLLIGSTISSIMLALFTANSGGAWDNAKKYVEDGHYGGRGSDAHKASVVGDTVGDPLKDTVGPSLDILIKIMAVVSLIGVSVFSKHNLFSFFFD